MQQVKEQSGKMFSSSMLARILHSQVYIGNIESKKDKISYPGKHQAIIDRKLFKEVQSLLNENRNNLSKTYNKRPYLLSNKLFDHQGNVFKNQQSLKKGARKYRYYALNGKYLPSGDIDEITINVIGNLLNHPLDTLVGKSRSIEFKSIDFLSLKPNEQYKLIRSMVKKVIYHNDKLTYFIRLDDLAYLKPYQRSNYLNANNATNTLNISKADSVESNYNSGEGQSCSYGNEGIHLMVDCDAIIFPTQNSQELVIEKNVCFNGHPLSNKYVGNGKKMISIEENHKNLIKALSIGWRYGKMTTRGLSIKKIQENERTGDRTIYRYLNLNYLSPNIVNDIMESKTPPHINLQTLFKIASKYPDFNVQERIFYDLDAI